MMNTDGLPVHARMAAASQIVRSVGPILAREPAAPAVVAADDVLDARAVLNDRIGAIVARIAPPEAEEDAPPIRLALAAGDS